MVESAHFHEALTGFFVDPRNGWFPPLTEAVAGLTAAASWAPTDGMNNIWAFVNHVRFWHDVVLNQLLGLPVDRQAIGAENGWPPPGDPPTRRPGTTRASGPLAPTLTSPV